MKISTKRITPTKPALWLLLYAIMFFCISLSAEEAIGSDEANTAELRQSPEQRTDAFYRTISERSERNWLLRRVYPMVFRTDIPGAKMRWEDANYDAWSGKRISRISILSLDVFNGRKSLRRNKAYMAMIKVGNAMHIDTRQWIVRENLLFKEGQSIDPGVLKRNLSYLNGLDYISEAYILVLPVGDGNDDAEVVVLIRDKFSLYPGFERDSKTRYKIKLNDHNFLGWGQQLENTWHIDSERKGSVGWESFYSVANIRGSFIGGDISWQDIPGFTRNSLAFERPFLFPALSHAGGLSFRDTYIHPPADSISLDKTELGAWLAHSSRVLGMKDNRYKYAAISAEKIWHKTRPEVAELSGRMWHDKLLVMGSLALTQSDYVRLEKTSSFVGNERLPVGFLLEFPFGYELGEFADRQFIGFRWGRGKVVLGDAYMYLESDVETYIRKGKPEQSVFCLKPMLISPLRSFGSYSTRTFYRGRLTLGKNRFSNESLELSNDPFYRGNIELSGDNMLAFSLEQDFNAPLSILGFDVTLYGFADGAIITDTPLRPKMEEIVMVEGVGMRLRNPRLVWRSMQLQVAWNQTHGKFGSPHLSFGTHLPVKLLQFEGRRPKPYEF